MCTLSVMQVDRVGLPYETIKQVTRMSIN